MFRVADQNKVWWPVTLTQTNGPDDVEEVEVWLLFRIFDRAELREREKVAVERMASRAKASAAQQLSAEHLLGVLETVAEHDGGDEADLVERVCDWRGFGTAAAEEPYGPDKLRALITTRPIYSAFRAALFEASREAPRKNSTPGLAGMPARVQA